MIILPHVEGEVIIDEVMDAGMGRLGHRNIIIFTSHKPNSNSLTSRFAHFLVKEFPDRYEEKADKKGISCSQVK